MKAIILAAGRGSRMKNLTDERPKCLVELRGKCLLEWQLYALRAAGISDIAIVTGYKHEFLKKWGLKEFYNPRWAETNMVSSLECAGQWLKESPCIISYSDIFYESSAVVALINSSSSLGLTYDANWRSLWERRFGDPLLDAETFRVNKNGTITEIGNKPQTLNEIEGQYMGLLRFTPIGWAEMLRIRATLSDKECDSMHMTGALQKIIEGGKVPIVGLAYHGEWGEVDCQEDLAVYR